ncbi:hypothetical protein [Ectopseudomonas oleovorans]|uniref:hypothetical protein n=1 Tax=Ectopseudomonas oleovorans TaxID=301 RepID=UPI0011C07B82|nr:hypothetical protein [Pseudomonas oleovorans]
MTPNHLQQAIARATAAGDEVMVAFFNAPARLLPGAAEINQLVGNLWNSGWVPLTSRSASSKRVSRNGRRWHCRPRRVRASRWRGRPDLHYPRLAHRTGLNAAADYAQVVASQYSKFDPTEEDALKTKAKYDALAWKPATSGGRCRHGRLGLRHLLAKDQIDARPQVRRR